MGNVNPFERRATGADRQRAKDLAEAKKRFAEAVQQGIAFAIDRFGNKIGPGDTVLHFPLITSGLMATVADVIPDLHPNAPMGALRVMLEIKIPLQVPAGMPQMSLLKIANMAGKDDERPTAPQTPVEITGDLTTPPDTLQQTPEESPEGNGQTDGQQEAADGEVAPGAVTLTDGE